MREIKFRCWFADRMWHRIPSIEFRESYIKVNLNESSDDFGLVPDTWTGYDDFVLMQYTGLKDKNGVEIYEGDILRIDDPEDTSIFEVVWGFNGWSKKYKGWDESLRYNNIGDFDLDWYYIIGNIYQNPELLK